MPSTIASRQRCSKSVRQLEQLIVDLDLPVLDAIPQQPGEAAEVVGAQEAD